MPKQDTKGFIGVALKSSPEGQMDAAFAIRQATSLLRTAQFLYDRFQETATEQVEQIDAQAAFGYALSSVLLRAFATEISLKVLCYQETGELAKSDRHDLAKIFRRLRPSTQQSLDLRFRTKRKHVGDGGRKTTIAEVLADHTSDFDRWRYPYEEEGMKEMWFEDIYLAAEAISEELSARFPAVW